MAITDLVPQGSGDSVLATGITPQSVGAPSSAASSQAQSVLDASNQPAPAAPVYQAPPPTQDPSFFGRLLQGALNGLAGSLQQGQQNIAGAGTPGFTPGGNGLAYAQQLQARQDAQRAAAEKARQDQAQQQFENQNKTFEETEQGKMQQAQTASAKLNGIHLAQQIQYANEDRQKAYYDDQNAQLKSAVDDGGEEVAHLKVGAGKSMQDVGADYLKENPTLMTDPNVHIFYDKDANGETEVHIVKYDKNARVSGDEVNQHLAAIGSDVRVPKDYQLTYHDAQRLYGDQAGKVADQHNAAKVEQLKFDQQQKLEAQKEAAERQLEGMRQSGEDRRASTKASGGDGGDIVQTTAEGIADGNGQTLDQLPAKLRPAVQAYLTQHHPNLDQASVTTVAAMRTKQQLADTAVSNLDDISKIIDQDPNILGKIGGRITNLKTLIGSNDPNIARLGVALDNYGQAAVGIHGSRSVKNKEDAANALLNAYHNGPQAAQAAIDEAKQSAQTFVRTPKSRNGSAYIVIPQGNGQALTDRGVWNRFLAKANGDPVAAEKLAQQNGWK